MSATGTITTSVDPLYKVRTRTTSLRVGLRKNLALVVLLIANTVYSVLFSWIATQRYAAFDSSLDLGSNLAIMEGVIRGWQPAWILITHEGALFSYVFVPLLWVVPSANAVLVAQTLIIASGSIPLYFLARLKLRSEALALVIGGVYLICPSIQALNWFDFHPEILGMPFIFAFFYFWETHETRLAAIFCLLALSVSTLVAMGLVAWLVADSLLSVWARRTDPAAWAASRRDRLTGLALTLIGGGFLIGVALLSLYLTQGIGVVTSQAGVNLTYPGVGNSELSILLAPLLAPHAFVSNLLYQLNLKVLYLVLLFGLFLFLPLLDIRALFGTLPWLYLALSSTNTPLYTVPYFQYSALLVPFLFFGFVNVVSKKGIPFLEDWGLAWFAVVVVLPFAVDPPYYAGQFAAFAGLLLVFPVVIVLALALRIRRSRRVPVGSSPRLKPPWSEDLEPAPTPETVPSESPKSSIGLTRRALGLDASPKANERRRRASVVLALATTAILLFCLWTPYGPLSGQYVGAYVKPDVTQHDVDFDQIIDLVPPNSTIIAQDHLYAHLWDYEFVSVHPTPGMIADFILGDVGPTGAYQADYYLPIVTPFPALSEIVLENLTDGVYGVLAEDDGYFLLEHNFTGPPRLFVPLDVSVDPCSLNTLPSANMQCVNNILEQTANPSGTSTVWYGPYSTLPPGNFTVQFQVAINRTDLAVSPITLGVYSYLPGSTPVSQTLAVDVVNSSAFSGPGIPATFVMNFTVPYPAFIQFVGNYVPAGVDVELTSLEYRQISTDFVNLPMLITRLISTGASLYTQPSLSPLFGWRAAIQSKVSNSTQYLLGYSSGTDFYTQQAASTDSSIADALYSAALSGSYGILAESGGYLLLERDYRGSPELFSPVQGSVDPCSLNTFPSASMECVANVLQQSSNANGVSTVWYGPYITLLPGNYSVVFDIALNRTPSVSPVTLGVSSFLPANNSISQTLASVAVSPNEFTANQLDANLTLSFNITYPALIQFTGGYEPPGLLLSLLGLSYIQHSS